jgi:hypothetical protein
MIKEIINITAITWGLLMFSGLILTTIFGGTA